MITRRQVFHKLALAAGTVAATLKAGVELTDACTSPKTPKQPEGPFYPVVGQPDTDTDLTRVIGKTGVANGQLIYVSGTVMDRNCEPIPGALVEIWQACASGRYNHPGDDSGLPLDAEFQYWGITRTNDSGLYRFKTILPGSYPAGNGWIRPPHIHYKVSKLGFRELITQLYFEGDPLNDADRILSALPLSDRVKVVRQIVPDTNEVDVSRVDFPITLESVA